MSSASTFGSSGKPVVMSWSFKSVYAGTMTTPRDGLRRGPGSSSLDKSIVSGGACQIVEKCLAEGARVSFIDIDAEAAKLLLARLSDSSDRVVFGLGDVRRADDIARVHAAAVAALGQLGDKPWVRTARD